MSFNLNVLIVTRFGDKTTFDNLVTKFRKIDPSQLCPIVDNFSEFMSALDENDERLVGILPLVSARIKWLHHQIRSLDKPFSWEMPDAVFPDNEKVQTFLRGSDEMLPVLRTTALKKIQDARNFASKWSRKEQVNASFVMEAGGTNRNAFVNVRKTRKWHSICQIKLKSYRTELSGLMERFGNFIGGDGESKRKQSGGES